MRNKPPLKVDPFLTRSELCQIPPKKRKSAILQKAFLSAKMPIDLRSDPPKPQGQKFSLLKGMFMKTLAKPSTNGVGKIMSAQQTFGSNVFSDFVMKQRLPKPIYASLQKVMTGETSAYGANVADVVAGSHEKMGH